MDYARHSTASRIDAGHRACAHRLPDCRAVPILTSSSPDSRIIEMKSTRTNPQQMIRTAGPYSWVELPKTLFARVSGMRMMQLSCEQHRRRLSDICQYQDGHPVLNATVFPGNHNSRVAFPKSRILSICTLHNLNHTVSKFNHGSSPVRPCIVPCLTAQPPLDKTTHSLVLHSTYLLSYLSHTPYLIRRYVHTGASSSGLGRAEVVRPWHRH
ncbi:hypothetical protein CONLIGDRAFT_519770 [Coniochaeta ligniaria NRRL 30616]|uniref:Uncharacterized protein n=1 Tax=Coniochaeta ligniaria NRRL 30616 TaxID=1408157 RepID=A0A1J7J8K2_9PEZI|nr:hypothetical protein CONLIGDRAFT_519770 [Coniochaeta ligniaria NRRL 30616]